MTREKTPFGPIPAGIKFASKGISMREYFAAAALPGVIAANEHSMSPRAAAKEALEYADALIEELSEQGES